MVFKIRRFWRMSEISYSYFEVMADGDQECIIEMILSGDHVRKI